MTLFRKPFRMSVTWVFAYSRDLRRRFVAYKLLFMYVVPS